MYAQHSSIFSTRLLRNSSLLGLGDAVFLRNRLTTFGYGEKLYCSIFSWCLALFGFSFLWWVTIDYFMAMAKALLQIYIVPYCSCWFVVSLIGVVL
jgi:hypothetical protein